MAASLHNKINGQVGCIACRFGFFLKIIMFKIPSRQSFLFHFADSLLYSNCRYESALRKLSNLISRVFSCCLFSSRFAIQQDGRWTQLQFLHSMGLMAFCYSRSCSGCRALSARQAISDPTSSNQNVRFSCSLHDCLGCESL